MPVALWWVSLVPLLAVAFLLRVGVHAGRSPGGIDTWYYLAYADAFRRRPGLDVRLPQYLLQDERQSYPPLFPSLLALLPPRWLGRFFWTISPAIDCLHMSLLYFVTYRLTASVVVALVAGATYACTPHLIAETRSLSARPFGALLHSVAIICLLKYVLGGGALPWLMLALVTGASLYLASAAMAAAYGIITFVLSVVFLDVRYLLIGAGSAIAAIALSGGHYLQVIRNYIHAVAYWRRHRGRFGSHCVRDSPIYGQGGGGASVVQRPGFLGRTTAEQLLRLLGENPVLLALPFAPRGFVPWGPRLHTWAVALFVLSIVATVLPPLRAFGPGRSYMKAGVFPTAYTLAYGIGSAAGLRSTAGIAMLLGLGFSLGAIWFFYAYVRGRETEQTASTPSGLAEAVASLADRPAGGVFVLPYMYADYACYHSRRPVLWGGHCGDLSRFTAITPVIARPLPELFREYGVRYVILDRRYVRPEEVGLPDFATRVRDSDSFVTYEVR